MISCDHKDSQIGWSDLFVVLSISWRAQRIVKYARRCAQQNLKWVWCAELEVCFRLAPEDSKVFVNFCGSRQR